MTQKPFAASMASSAATSSGATSSERSRPVLTNAEQSSGLTAQASCASKESGATASDDSWVNALNNPCTRRRHARVRHGVSSGTRWCTAPQPARRWLAQPSGCKSARESVPGVAPVPAVRGWQAQTTKNVRAETRLCVQRRLRQGTQRRAELNAVCAAGLRSSSFTSRRAEPAGLGVAYEPRLRKCRASRACTPGSSSTQRARLRDAGERRTAQATPAQPTCAQHAEALRADVSRERRLHEEQQRLVDEYRFSRLDVTRRDQAYAAPGYVSLRHWPHGPRGDGSLNTTATRKRVGARAM